MNDENTQAANDDARDDRIYPDVFSYEDIMEDNGEELGGAIADAIEGLDESALFSLVNSPEDVQEGWQVIVDRRDIVDKSDKEKPVSHTRVLVLQTPTVEALMATEDGDQFVRDAVEAALGRKISAVARSTIVAKDPSFPLPQTIEGLIANIRTSKSGGKKRLPLRAFRAVVGTVTKALNAAYAKQGVAIRFDISGLKACLADAGLAESQHASLKPELWDTIFNILEEKITEYVKTYEPKEGDEKAPKELDLAKELAQLHQWKATRHEQAEKADIVIESIDFT